MTDRIQRVLTGIAAVGVMSIAPLACADQIVADELDAAAEGLLSGPSTTKVGDWDGRVGEWWGGDCSWVMPFQLPDLGVVDNPFATASFRGDLGWKNDDSGGELDNVDLYVLNDLRAVGDVMHEDYGAPATMIQDDFFTPDSADWNVVRTDAAANIVLRDFLNAAYDGGAGVGKFVFLRYSYDGFFTVQEAYTVLTSNASQTWEKPTIEYTLAETTIVADLGDALAEQGFSGVSTTKIDDWDGRVGEWWGLDSAWIMPFALPDLGATSDPFDTASFRSYLVGIADDSFNELDNVDLYVLDAIRATPEVFHEDYDAAATLIQDNYYTPLLLTWRNYTTDAAGDAALLAFLNTAYADGAGAGQFVFLRMTYDGLFTAQEAYRPGAANAGFDTEWPTIIYTTSQCTADWNGDVIVNTSDFLAYLNDYNAVAGGGPYTYSDPDIAPPFGVLNTADFIAFLNAFVAGCP